MHEVLLTKEKRLIKIAFCSNFATKLKADVCVMTCLCNGISCTIGQYYQVIKLFSGAGLVHVVLMLLYIS
jgi:hypothetical protein